jgi:hypothetical protein
MRIKGESEELQAWRKTAWLASGTLLSQHLFTGEKILLSGRLLTTVLAMRKQVSFMQGNKRAQGSTDMSYQIRVEGHLDLSWQEWFEGLPVVCGHGILYRLKPIQ